jgi:hypothetical protein
MKDHNDSVQIAIGTLRGFIPSLFLEKPCKSM